MSEERATMRITIEGNPEELAEFARRLADGNAGVIATMVAALGEHPDAALAVADHLDPDGAGDDAAGEGAER